MFAALKTLIGDWYGKTGSSGKVCGPVISARASAAVTSTPKWKPYRSDQSPINSIDIETWCHAVREGMINARLSNPFDTYERAIDGLKDDPRNQFLPLRGFAVAPEAGERQIYLRHDCDADIFTAVRMARFLRDQNVTGSFYLLHTSYYYGEFRDDVFYRHAALDDFVNSLLQTGQEIGLHNDPLHIYLAHGIDGTEAMRAELVYLRSLGASITGVVAHNSALAYGAENFEVFEGLSRDNRNSVEWNGATLPLQNISLEELGLDYEGNYSLPALPEDGSGRAEFHAFTSANTLRDPRWQKLYFLHNPYFRRSNDVSVWIVARDEWLVACHREPMWMKHKLTTDEMLRTVRDLQARSIVVAIHPEYFGG
jgi:hypothetical protein